jgi:hypothetical protein
VSRTPGDAWLSRAPLWPLGSWGRQRGRAAPRCAAGGHDRPRPGSPVWAPPARRAEPMRPSPSLHYVSTLLEQRRRRHHRARRLRGTGLLLLGLLLVGWWGTLRLAPRPAPLAVAPAGEPAWPAGAPGRRVMAVEPRWECPVVRESEACQGCVAAPCPAGHAVGRPEASPARPPQRRRLRPAGPRRPAPPVPPSAARRTRRPPSLPSPSASRPALEHATRHGAR